MFSYHVHYDQFLWSIISNMQADSEEILKHPMPS